MDARFGNSTQRRRTMQNMPRAPSTYSSRLEGSGIVSFGWDYRNVMAGGTPKAFPCPIFLAGETFGPAGFSLAIIRNGQRSLRSA